MSKIIPPFSTILKTLFIVFAFFSCNKEEVADTSDLENELNAVLGTVQIKADFTLPIVTEFYDSISGGIATNGGTAVSPYIGYLYNPSIGEVVSNGYVPFNATSIPTLLGLSPIIKKVFLFLAYHSETPFYGVNPNGFIGKSTWSIYEPGEDIYFRRNFLISRELSLGNKISKKTFNPNRNDSVVYIVSGEEFSLGKGIDFELEENYAINILNYYNTHGAVSGVDFVDKFHGIAVIPKKPFLFPLEDSTGSLVRINWSESYVGLIHETEGGTILTRFPLNPYNNQRFEKIILTPSIKAEIEDTDYDSLLYLYSRTQLVVDISSLDALFEEEDITIHDAKLNLKLHKYSKTVAVFTPAAPLLSVFYYNNEGERILIPDISARNSVYHGGLNFDPNDSDDNTVYTINISIFLQRIIENDSYIGKNKLYIQIPSAIQTTGWAIIENSKNSSQTNLEVTYSKNY